jgi:hypothetical protein
MINPRLNFCFQSFGLALCLLHCVLSTSDRHAANGHVVPGDGDQSRSHSRRMMHSSI